MSKEETTTPDEIEDEVLNTLPTLGATELEEICTVIALDCKQELKGKRSSLLKYLLKHLCDLEGKDDNGMSTFLLIQEHLNKDVKGKQTPEAVPSVVSPVV